MTTQAQEHAVDALLTAAVTAVGGSHRPGQQEMTRAVAAALESGEHLLVQAGTGTGKSVGYLVPAIARAVATGRPVVVSTATLALQAQVIDRDLPRLAAALEGPLGRRPTFAMVKGRGNYVCKHKLDGGLPADEDDVLLPAETLWGGPPTGSPGGAPVPSVGGETGVGRLGREVVRLRAWAEETASGDRDELVPGVSAAAWRQVSVPAHECLGTARCPVAQECFSEQARAAGKRVDVVVTNHAFCAVDAFEGRQMLPEHDVLIVDEAHELADRVTSVVTDELSAGMVHAVARRARGSAGAGDVATSAADVDAAADELARALEELPAGRFVDGLPGGLALAVAAVRDAARAAVGALKPERGEAGEVGDGARHVARTAAQQVFTVAERLSMAAPRDVVWLTVSERRPATLCVAPLSVATSLREKLLADRTAIFTSATLALGGTFDPVARQLGLTGGPPSAPDAKAVRWNGLDVGSPFDYPSQAILYVASRLPPPGREGPSERQLEELAELVTAAGGRTLGLFSSRRGAEAAAAALRSRLDVPVLCQGDDVTATLVRQFARDARTCLVGTMSLWQGVDVPGPACQLVVVDRIPFPRPDDPLLSARTEAVERGGGNGFMTVSATHAALRLAQGVGRLLRSTQDRGVVAVLDPRLETARYAGYLRAGLPPFWTTTEREVVLAALRRLDAAAGQVLPVAEPQARGSGAAGAGRRPPMPAPTATTTADPGGRVWSPAEDAGLLAGLRARRSVTILADRYDCTVEQLTTRARRLGHEIGQG